MTTVHTLCAASQKNHTGIYVNITNAYTMKKQFMLIKRHLNFKSLSETVTWSVSIFESRTEVVYKDPRVIDIQLLRGWAGSWTCTEKLGRNPPSVDGSSSHAAIFCEPGISPQSLHSSSVIAEQPEERRLESRQVDSQFKDPIFRQL